MILGRRRLSRRPARSGALIVGLLGLVGAGLAAAASRRDDPPKGPVARVPFELSGSSLFIKVKVNGIGPRWFVLDTGALRSVVDASVARELRLETAGPLMARGAAGRVEATALRHVTIETGPARLPDLTATALDLTGIAETIGRRVDGIVGSDLFRRFVVEIDFDQRELTLHEPAGWTPRPGAEVLPLTFLDEHPYVHASVRLPGGAEIAGDFVIDTGSSVPLILSPSIIAGQGLRSSLPPLLGAAGRAVGGALSIPLGRAESLSLGRFKLDRPITGFPSQGMFGREDKAGNIGNAVLRRFRAAFDYARNRVSLEPNGSYSDPYEHDMSGATVVTQAPEFRVRTVQAVIDGSPAKEAGLEPGDTIVALDGRDAAELPLSSMRERFRLPGKTYVLSVRRGERTFTATIVTRRLV
jgi:predicted aspartyl protease